VFEFYLVDCSGMFHFYMRWQLLAGWCLARLIQGLIAAVAVINDSCSCSCRGISVIGDAWWKGTG